ncbi:MAG: TonB-dependent receptor, partial [Chitinophagaceae bacterium]
MRIFAVLLFSLHCLFATAQNKTATVSGVVVDENETPLPGISIVVLGKNTGILSNDSGRFEITVAAEKSLALVFTHSGFSPVQKNFFLSPGETEVVVVRLLKAGQLLNEVVVTDEKERNETGLVKVNPKTAITMPSTIGGVEGMIKTLVGSNNELTSQYSVRGGNYDENMIYINDFEVYRPYLVSSGQQEGLSLINPELAKNVSFYTGGFQAKYGDKMSSVLDIQYKKPAKFAGSAYVSLLEQGLALEGSAKKGRVTYLAAVRNKNNRNLLNNQPTQGAYIPAASDAQAYLTYALSRKWQLELLGIFSSSRFTFFPESVKKTTSVFSPLFTANLGLDIYFEGQERDSYKTALVGASILHSPTRNLKLKWMLSRFKDTEIENFDIAGAYIFGSRDFDANSSSYG